jgi:hypothetical protein
MDIRIIELIKEIREMKSLTKAVRDEVLEVRKLAGAAIMEAKNSKRQADAAWELVVITRQEMNRPIWKKWFGLS